jgi:hypothetical protein
MASTTDERIDDPPTARRRPRTPAARTLLPNAGEVRDETHVGRTDVSPAARVLGCERGWHGWRGLGRFVRGSRRPKGCRYDLRPGSWREADADNASVVLPRSAACQQVTTVRGAQQHEDGDGEGHAECQHDYVPTSQWAPPSSADVQQGILLRRAEQARRRLPTPY